MLKRLVLCLIISALLCTGCWDVEEVNNRALPNTLFFDIGQQDNVRVGIDLHVPGTLLPPVNTMDQQFEKNHGVIYAEGKSAVEAWSKLQTLTSRNIFFGQLRAIIISDNFAKQDINDSLNLIGRIPFVSGDTLVLMTKDDPTKLVDIKNKSNFIPGNYIEQYFRSSYKEMLAEPIRLFELFACIDNKTTDPYFPMITTSQGDYLITGTGLFADNHLVGELNQKETYTFSLLRGRGTGFLTLPLEQNKVISFLQLDANTKIVPKYNSDGTLTFEVNVKINGMLAETDPFKGQLTIDDKKKFDQAAEKFIQLEIEKLLLKLQQLNSDSIGFGEKFRSKYPDLWNKNDWKQVFSKAKFLVNVDFNTKKSGIFR